MSEPGDPRFYAILEQMRAMHAAKGQDYGSRSDPLANLRAAEEFGIEAWRGALVRMNDKVTRLKSFCVKGTLACEGVEDSLIDIACYAVLTLLLYREKADG